MVILIVLTIYRAEMSDFVMIILRYILKALEFHIFSLKKKKKVKTYNNDKFITSIIKYGHTNLIADERLILAFIVAPMDIPQ